MHIGIEVEGRLKGVYTIFVSAEEFMSGEYHQKILTRSDIPHVYISDHDNLIDLQAINHYAQVTKKIVTMERTDVGDDPDAISHLNIILYVPTNINILKPTDQVKFDTPDKYVWTATVENMYKTIPSDFDGDQIV